MAKNVLKDEATRWQNGVVPYRIKQAAHEVDFIKRVMNVMTKMTGNCIRFVERTNEKDYILFIRGLGCSSNVGRQGGQQKVSLTRGCLENMGDVQHELMHVLGFYHEMSRTDRDQYIAINWANIDEDDKQQFKMFTDGKTFGLPYDYESVMQYPFNAFALDKRMPTMVPKEKYARIGQNKNLTPLDVLKIQKAYNCEYILDPASVENGPLGQSACPAKPEILEGQSINDSELAPPFVFKKKTVEECRSLNTETCTGVADDSFNCSDTSPIYIKCSSSEEIISVTSKIKKWNDYRPIKFGLSDRQAVREIFQEVRNRVIYLDISDCLNRMTTSKLPGLNIPNLLFIGLVKCQGLTVNRQDFSSNLKLRYISFYRTTITTLEINTFTNLPDLEVLTLEYLWSTSKPFTSNYMAYLLRFHCDCQYWWFRKWLKSHPRLISSKNAQESYRIAYLHDWNLDRKHIYAPVDCSEQELNDAVFDESQISYSVNDVC